MTPPAKAFFASLRGQLLVIESPAIPEFSNGRQIGLRAGVSHQFRDHRCLVHGQKSIDYMRARCNAPDSPGLWELDADDVPEVTEILAELVLADVDRVRDILQAEQQSANRQIVLETCQAVLNRMGASERKPGQKATVTA